MPAPTNHRRTQPSSDDKSAQPVYNLPKLGEITHVKTAARTYSLGGYKQAIFIGAATPKELAEAGKNGGDPVALSLYGSNVLVLIKADGTQRIIPAAAIIEYSVEKTSK